MDYDLVYKFFHLVVVEAKKEIILEGIIQNIVQLVVSRDSMAYERNKRRRDELETDDLLNIPSRGLVSTGEDWIFTKYVCEHQVWKLY